MSVENLDVVLVTPSNEYRDSYRALVEEFRNAQETFIPWVLGFPCENFDEFLTLLESNSRGENLEVGYMPHSTYWLVDKKSLEVLGVSNLRHKLSPYLERRGGHVGYGVRPSQRRKGYATLILAETLKKAAARDITKVLMTCAKTNLASRKTIENNGGVFHNEEFLLQENEIIQRFWISQ